MKPNVCKAHHYFLKQQWIPGLFVLLFISFIGKTQDITETESAFRPTPLFSSDAMVNLTILFDHKELLKGKAKTPEYENAGLIYHAPDGSADTFDIKIKPRGYSRRVYSFCSFPPIMLNFKKKEVENTLFHGQDKLKLVAFCKDTDLNEQYNMQEYLAYKAYNLFTPYSFKVRLARITYQDREDKKKPVTRLGFVIESEEEMAARNAGILINTEIPNHDRCDRESIDQLTVFQYMIGNTDWWVGNFHNIKLLQVDGKMPIPIPYDFDYAGIVNTNYAQPDEQLGIETVRERVFRGYCRFPGEYEKTMEIFNQKKEALYDLYGTFEYLDDRQEKSTIDYLDDFYKIINDPKQVKVEIYDACQLAHQHLHRQ